jgi:hypothetical protein
VPIHHFDDEYISRTILPDQFDSFPWPNFALYDSNALSLAVKSEYNYICRDDEGQRVDLSLWGPCENLSSTSADLFVLRLHNVS